MNNQGNSSERCLTGIPGLDELLEGGLPQGKSMILIGGPGSGKTIFLSQFIHNGFIKYNEPGIFITFHESSENIKENMLVSFPAGLKCTWEVIKTIRKAYTFNYDIQRV